MVEAQEMVEVLGEDSRCLQSPSDFFVNFMII